MNNTVLLKKTSLVILTTLIAMIVEIYFGFTTHSMALLADGFHMATHSVSFLITFAVCLIILKYKNKEEKLNALGGYTSAILLLLTALGIFVESILRFINPETISFSQAIIVAIIGLIVNGICILLMGENHNHEHHHSHHCEKNNHNVHNENLNYKAAYIHILADALTSILAIVALLLAKYFNLVFLDPLMGLVGAYLIFKWSINLLKKSSKILTE